MRSRLPLSSQDKRALLLLGGILLIATNLRAPITGLAPVLGMIRDSFGLSTARAGLLTTLPLLAFALLSPFAPWLARRWGLERALFGALILIACGVTLRSGGQQWGLFAGTAVIGAGIAVGNVLLPALLKRDFPSRIAIVTGAYALTMGLAAGVVSATVFPLATGLGLGWPGALLAMLALPTLAMVLWLPQLGLTTIAAQAGGVGTLSNPIWRHALAWLGDTVHGFQLLYLLCRDRLAAHHPRQPRLLCRRSRVAAWTNANRISLARLTARAAGATNEGPARRGTSNGAPGCRWPPRPTMAAGNGHLVGNLLRLWLGSVPHPGADVYGASHVQPTPGCCAVWHGTVRRLPARGLRSAVGWRTERSLHGLEPSADALPGVGAGNGNARYAGWAQPTDPGRRRRLQHKPEAAHFRLISSLFSRSALAEEFTFRKRPERLLRSVS